MKFEVKTPENYTLKFGSGKFSVGHQALFPCPVLSTTINNCKVSVVFDKSKGKFINKCSINQNFEFAMYENETTYNDLWNDNTARTNRDNDIVTNRIKVAENVLIVVPLKS